MSQPPATPGPGPYAPHPGVSYGPADAGPDQRHLASPSITPPSGTPGAQSSSSRAVGWVGVGLLYAVAVWQLVLPTIALFTRSVTSGSTMVGGEPEYVGFENWSRVLPTLADTVGFLLMAVLPVVLVSLVLGLVIGSAMTTSSRTATPVRVLVAVLGACFVPLGVGLSRWVSAEPGALGSPSSARTFLIVTITLAWLPLLTAVFATAFGAALSGRRGSRTIGLVAGVGLLAAVPIALQLFDLPRTLTNGGPDGATATPLTVAYLVGLQQFELGPAAAVCAVVLLVAGVFGLAAVALVAGVAARGVVVPSVVPPPSAGRSGSGVLGAVVAALVLVLAVVTVWPVLTGGTDLPTPDQTATGVALRTWTPVALGIIVQVLLGVAAGAAIGWCRPAGRSSLWLLMPLAPWLFVGQSPFLIAGYESFAGSGLVNTWGALVPQPTLVVAAVVVFAILFAGLRDQGSRPPIGVVLAAAAGLAAVLLLVQGQSLVRSLLLVSDPELATAPVVIVMITGQFAQSGELPLGILYPIPVLLAVAALGIVAQLGLRRVALVRG